MRIFGYTQEDLRTIISPMSTSGKEAIGSMGVDTPLAVLSDRPQLLYNYFKQDGLHQQLNVKTNQNTQNLSKNTFFRYTFYNSI